MQQQLEATAAAAAAAAVCEQASQRYLNRVMERVLGQRYTSLQFKLPFSCIYSLLLLLGAAGNLCTCLVIARTKYLHTATNLYLFSLAVSDLTLLLIGLPHELYSILIQQYPWQFSSEFCKIRNFLAELTPAVSVMTITCFTVERYIAIVHPLKAQILSSFKRTLLIIASIWTLGCAVCSPVAVASSPIAYVTYPNVSGSGLSGIGCPAPEWANLTGNPMPQSVVCHCANAPYCTTHFQISSFAFFLFPVGIIAVLYLLIAVTLRRSAPIAVAAGRRQEDVRNRNSVVRMLVVIVVTFFICWAPFHFQRLLALYHVLQYLPAAITNALYFCSGSLFYVSSTLNPVFYNLMSAKFRQAFRSMFCCCSHSAVVQKYTDGKSYHGNTIVSRANGISPSPSANSGHAVQLLLQQQQQNRRSSKTAGLTVCSAQLTPAGAEQPQPISAEAGALLASESSL